MLERVAANVERRSLQQIFARHLPQPRAVHTSSCPRFDHSQPPAALSRRDPEPTSALTPYLDFLYPSFASSFLHSSLLNLSCQRCRGRKLVRHGPPTSHYMSTSGGNGSRIPGDDDLPSAPGIEPPESTLPQKEDALAYDEKNAEARGLEGVQSLPEKDVSLLSPERDQAIDDVRRRALLDLERIPPYSPDGVVQALGELLEDHRGDRFLDVWDLFVRLTPDDRDQLRPLVLTYLSRSRGIVEAGRAVTLFEQTPLDAWDNDTVSAAIVVLLRSGQQDKAMRVFQQGLKAHRLLGGMEYLLIDTFNHQQWNKAVHIWLKYFRSLAKWDPEAKADYELLNAPMSLPHLGSLYASFERYLTADNGVVEKRLIANKVSRDGLWVLRRAFAKSALMQQCPPSEALAILQFWKETKLYDNYLRGAFGMWYQKRINRTRMAGVTEIYDHYLQHPNAKPSLDVLRGMFKFYFPDDDQGLEKIYNDWLRCYGELNLWGFTKYMKLYASRGDIQTVQTLWNRCVEHFPEITTSPRGFYSLLNAHAQAGYVAGIQEELHRMEDVYNVKPDIDCWNAMLKGYSRIGDLSGALSCFEDVRLKFQPDSFTYGQVMAASAKVGDLELTLDLFNQAQLARVDVTRELILPLILAYCLNDRLQEADDVAYTLAQRGVTSTMIWNQLIHYNGMHGRLNRCYGILRDMATFKLDWDRETYTYLLQALITVNQLETAVQILKGAAKAQLPALHPDHYAIVMMGAAKTGSRMYAEAIMSMMNKRRIPVPFNAQVAYAKVAQEVAPHAVRTPQLRPNILKSLRARVEDSAQDIRMRRSQTTNIGNAITLMLQAADESEADELIKLYITLDPNVDTSHELPQNVIASLMLAEQRYGRHQTALRMWQSVWPEILLRATRNEDAKIFPARQYEVTRLILRVAQSYRALDDGDSLEKDVLRALDVGFKFTNSTWDHVIRILCELGKWERAMELMEEYLMEGWRGWRGRQKDKKRPIMFRRAEMNTRYLRPTSFAVSAVMRHWLDARKLIDWSSAVRRKLEHLKVKYPKMHRAFDTAGWKDIHGPWTFSADVDFNKAVDSVLRNATYSELRAMEFYLDKEIARKTDEEPKFVKTSMQQIGKNILMDKEDLKALRISLELALADYRRRKADAVPEWTQTDADAVKPPEPPQPLDPFEAMLLNRRIGNPGPWRHKRTTTTTSSVQAKKEAAWETSSDELLLNMHLHRRTDSEKNVPSLTFAEMQALREQLSKMAPLDVRKTWERTWKETSDMSDRKRVRW